jgi:diguanylate cyclase (GGDEF)-like protein
MRLRLLIALGVGVATTHLVVALAEPGSVATGWLINAAFVIGAGLCLWRAGASRHERVAWACVGAGLLCQALADRYYKSVLAGQAQVSQPSLADFGFLAFYPLVAIGIVAMLRSRVSSATRPLMLDAAVLALAVAAVASAFLLPDVLTISGGNLSASVTNISYPVADLILLGLLVGGAQILRGKPDRALILMGAALTLFVTADSIFLYESAAGTYATGGWLDAFWSFAAVAMGIAAWQPTLRHAKRQAWESAKRAQITVVAAVVAATMVFHVAHSALVAGYLATATILAALARLVVSVRAEHETGRQLAISEARYQELALHDPLTGLANRSLFDDRVDRLLARRPPAQTALIMIDIDHFKDVNDSLGHGAGDELLTEVARRLIASVRPEDTVARLGGDEFCIAMSADDPHAAHACGERITTDLQHPYTLSDKHSRVSASVGIAVHMSGEETAADLQRHADQALYMAKAAGGAQLVVYGAVTEPIALQSS